LPTPFPAADGSATGEPLADSRCQSGERGWPTPGEQEQPNPPSETLFCLPEDGRAGDDDGFPVCATPQDFVQDCDDEDFYVGPLAIETCNGIDDDCDEETDEEITNCETATIPGPPAGTPAAR